MPVPPVPESPKAACDRLEAILERARALEAGGGGSLRAGDDAEIVRTPLIRYATAVVRMRVRPALEPGWEARDPVHVAMFGGTNSGKSTVLNVLLGRPAAGMSFRARFSQHPEAYRPTALGEGFLDDFGSRFAGYERFRDHHPPRQDDDDLRDSGYRPALAINDPETLASPDPSGNGGVAVAVAPPRLAPPAVEGAVLWDVPDFSTEESRAYLPAVLDTIALADLVVMAVTNENYADHRGALLRSMVVESGVPIRVVANKLEGGSALLDDVRHKLGGGIEAVDGGPTRRVPADRIHPLPHARGRDDLDRLDALIAAPEATAFRKAIAADVAAGPTLKRTALEGALAFLDRRLDDLLAPLRADVEASEAWGALVSRLTEREFADRYRRRYLDDTSYGDFNRTLVKLMDLLEIPGIGPYISAVSKGVKAVSKAVVGTAVGLFRRALGRPGPDSRKHPEEEVVIESFEHWYESIRAEARARAVPRRPSRLAGGRPQARRPRLLRCLRRRPRRRLRLVSGQDGRDHRRPRPGALRDRRQAPGAVEQPPGDEGHA